MSRTLTLLLLLTTSSVAFAQNELVKNDPFFDQAAPGAGAAPSPAVDARKLVAQAQAVGQNDVTYGPPLASEKSPMVSSPPPIDTKKDDGMLGGLKSFLKWDNRSLWAFGIGMGIGLGIVFFSGMLFANPLMAIVAGLFAGLVIGFMLNAFK